jgi:DNA-binding MarR family transcriptional regulator
MNLAGGNFPTSQTRSDRLLGRSNERGELQQQLSSLANQLLSVASTIVQGPNAQSGRVDHSDEAIARRLKLIIQSRRVRERYFSPNLFADPAWDILLDLAVARLENRQICVSSLAIAASVPTSTALRWIKALLELHLIVRAADPTDKRRTHIVIADEGFGKMIDYAKALERVL